MDKDIILRSVNLCKGFNGHTVFDNINFTITRGDFVTILGPSGCGKTTLLHIIASLSQPTKGELIIQHAHNSNTQKDVILIFQEYNKSLFPWKTVYQNMEFFLDRIKDRTEKERQIKKYLYLVNLQESFHKYPWQLSGGMQQRAVIARALAREPNLLLMDEPFGSLDASIKKDLELELLELWQRLGITILFVSHDIEEAIFLSTRILIMTNTPSKFIDDIAINLPYPRDYITTKNSQAFGDYRATILKYFS